MGKSLIDKIVTGGALVLGGLLVVGVYFFATGGAMPFSIGGAGGGGAVAPLQGECSGTSGSVSVSTFNAIDTNKAPLNATVAMYLGDSPTVFSSTWTNNASVAVSSLPVGTKYKLILGNTGTATSGMYHVSLAGEIKNPCVYAINGGSGQGMMQYGNLSQVYTSYQGTYKNSLGGTRTTVNIGTGGTDSIPVTVVTNPDYTFGKDGKVVICVNDDSVQFKDITIDQGTKLSSVPSSLAVYEHCNIVQSNELMRADGAGKFTFDIRFQAKSATDPVGNFTWAIKDWATYVDASGNVAEGVEDNNGNAVGFGLLVPAGQLEVI
jgi:hypothetical protein